jgi:predicted ArsR family transcriptional regulator
MAPIITNTEAIMIELLNCGQASLAQLAERTKGKPGTIGARLSFLSARRMITHESLQPEGHTGRRPINYGLTRKGIEEAQRLELRVAERAQRAKREAHA